MANGTAEGGKSLGKGIAPLSLLQYAWQDVKSEQALSPDDGIVAAFTSRSIFSLTARVRDILAHRTCSF